MAEALGGSRALVPGLRVGGVDVRGAAPGTRETDLLHPENTVEKVQTILLTGGSAFGLGAADGVVRYLVERGKGFPTPGGAHRAHGGPLRPGPGEDPPSTRGGGG